MQKMYYLFSKADSLESIYVCDENDYIDKPTLKTGVYPMGSLLSKALRIITPWAENEFNTFLKEEKLSEQFKGFDVHDSSFSNVLYGDSAVRIVFDLLFNHATIIRNKEPNRIAELLRNYTNYINICQQDKTLFSIEQLTFISNKMRNEMPHRTIYAIYESNNDSPLLEENMMNFLRNSNSLNGVFTPQPKKRTGDILFDYQEPQTPITQWGNLTMPLYVFDLCDIVDLILATLQCVSEQKYVICKCRYCESFFVTRNRVVKYCPERDLENKSCYEEAKLKRQLGNEKKESVKLHKILRTMYADKYGNTSDEYIDYMETNANWRGMVKTDEKSEDEYVEWLKSKFFRKYK